METKLSIDLDLAARLSTEAGPLTDEEMAEVIAGNLAPVAAASRILRMVGELRRERENAAKEKDAANYFHGLYREEHYRCKGLQQDLCRAQGRDTWEVEPLLRAVQDCQISIGRAMEYLLDWLTGLPMELPERDPELMDILSENERLRGKLESLRETATERLKMHRDNLSLWQTGYLTPTEPDPQERRETMERLKAAAHEDEQIIARIDGLLAKRAAT